MHNETSSELFDLIHAMKKGEKRYFKLYARARSPNIGDINYLRLFDTIEKQKKYNEEKIMRLGIVKKERMRALKHYLYYLILESISDLRSKEKNAENAIKNSLDNALTMQEKGLKQQEIRFIEKTKKLAAKHEQWGTLLDIFLMESNSIVQKADTKNWHNLKNEIQTLFEKISNLMEHQKMKHHIYLLFQKSGAITRHYEKDRMLKKIGQSEFLQNENKAHSVLAKNAYYWNLSSYYLLQNDHKNCYSVLNKYVVFLESNASIIPPEKSRYILVLNNHFGIQCLLGKYKEAFETLNKCHTLLQERTGITQEWLNYYINITHYYIIMGEFKKGLALVKDIEKKLEYLNSSVSATYTVRIMRIYFNIACLYFGSEDYRNALRWMNRIIQQPKTSLSEDIQSFTKIFVIIIHYELNTPDILDHLIISTHRYLSKRTHLHKFEKSILHFLGRLSKIDISQKILLVKFRKFHDELIQIIKDPEEEKVLHYFDLISWLESKIENRSFAEVVREKAEAEAS
jgi:tetratricopeptide (TPR) repeat protein